MQQPITSHSRLGILGSNLRNPRFVFVNSLCSTVAGYSGGGGPKGIVEYCKGTWLLEICNFGI